MVLPARPAVVVATHGHCFDGMASAVTFTALYRSLHPEVPVANVRFRACDYGPGDAQIPEGWFEGTDNALLDFRYTPSDKLTFYFDHHATAFRNDSDRKKFTEGLPRNGFYEPAYSSCTKLIADVARDTFGVRLPDLEALIHWADVIDAARFPDAESAVLRRDPELHLMTVVEHEGDDGFLGTMVPRLLERPLAEVACSPEVAARYRPLAEKRDLAMARMKQRSEIRGPVAYCDLSDDPGGIVEKFALYAIHPEAPYSVVLSRTASKLKISIGFNPWGPVARQHDIGALCARFGGGGHPVVGAINLPAAQAERAQVLVTAIVDELSR
jgi:hypothetical protein